MVSKYVQKMLEDFEELYDPKEYSNVLDIKALKQWKANKLEVGLCHALHNSDLGGINKCSILSRSRKAF